MLGVVKMVPILEEITQNKSEKVYKFKFIEEAKSEIQHQLLLVSLFEYFFGASNQLPEHLKVIIFFELKIFQIYLLIIFLSN